MGSYELALDNGPVEDSSEHGNDSSGSVKCW
jgi:hypothetical protein